MNNYYYIFVFLIAVSLGRIEAAQPNIVFVMTDQQSANALSCAQGSAFLNTPNMDSLAAKGVRFLRAYSPNPLCMPARASIFTGHYPHETGFQTNNSGLPQPPFSGMGTYFRKAGYQTYYFGKWHLAYKQNDVESHGFAHVVGKSSGKGGHDANVTEAAVSVLKEKQRSPFFAVVSYLNPHDICQYPRGEKFPSGPVDEVPPLDQCPPAPDNWLPPQDETDSVTAIRKAKHTLAQFPVGNYGKDDWRRLRWVYYRLVEKVDRELGKILQALHDSGNDENTMIVFTSDHGECAGAHGFNQKTVFYEESVGVPLIITSLGQNTVAETNSRLVNTGIDILPTLLDYAGIPIPEKLPGKSLRNIEKKTDADGNRDYLIVQNQMNQTGEIDGIRPSIEGRLVITDNFKYAVYSQGLRRESLYDLKNDPGETRNLASLPEFKTVLEANRHRLQEFAEKYSDTLAVRLLENNVVPIPITNSTIPFQKKKAAQ